MDRETFPNNQMAKLLDKRKEEEEEEKKKEEYQQDRTTKDVVDILFIL